MWKRKKKKEKRKGIWCSKCGGALQSLCFGIIKGNLVTITCKKCGKINKIVF